MEGTRAPICEPGAINRAPGTESNVAFLESWSVSRRAHFRKEIGPKYSPETRMPGARCSHCFQPLPTTFLTKGKAPPARQPQLGKTGNPVCARSPLS